MRPLIFGEVLFDRFSDGASVLGGAPFNVAWHLRGFGLDPLLITRIGDDQLGGEIMRAVDKWGLDARGIQVDASRPTGIVEVTPLAAGQHTFSIRPDQAYDFIDAAVVPDAVADGGIGLVYHGTLALRNPASRSALKAVLQTADAPVFLDVNLREPWVQIAELPELCARARWLKVNEDELTRISQSLGVRARRIEDQAVGLRQRFGLELLLVTRGAQGAMTWSANGDTNAIRPEASIRIADTVGAGDAFTAVVLYGLIGGWPLATTLSLAQAFANAICQVRGATVLDVGFYTKQTQQWRIAGG